MTKFAVCNEIYRDHSLAALCEDAAACGYDGLEIAPFTLAEDPETLTEADGHTVGETVRAAGLEAVGLHWLLARPEGLHLCVRDASVRARTVEHLVRLAHLCAAMGGRILVLGSPRQRSVPEGELHAEAFSRLAASCREVCERVESLDVVVALEPLAPRYTNMLTSAAETRALIRAVDHPACRLHLDVSAMAAEERSAPEIIAAHAAELVHFHANDESLCGPGLGATDFRPIARALRAADYRGYVSVEVFDEPADGPAVARRSLAYLRETWAAVEAEEGEGA